jgi:undecaprenyl-diphosphatase
MMDFWTAIQAVILGIVEGLTEFLPISSTGHQIIVADLINFGGERAMAFNIIIQLGAILAVVWEFRRKIIDVVVGLPNQANAQRFTVNLLIAFLPAVVFITTCSTPLPWPRRLWWVASSCCGPSSAST